MNIPQLSSWPFLSRLLPCFVAITAGFSIVPNSWADTPETQLNALRDGVWALQFESVLGPRTGVALAAKMHLSSRSAMRFTLGLETDSSDMEQSVTGTDTNPGDGLGRSFDRKVIGVSTQYLLYPQVASKVVWFLGAGPLVEWGRDESIQVSQHSYSQGTMTIQSEAEGKRLSLGGEIVLGFEWFLTRRVSLITHQGLAIRHTRIDETETQREMRSGSDPAEFKLSGSGELMSVDTTWGGFGFSFYFGG